MEKLRVYFNPACSKCKKLQVLLAGKDLEVDWVNYLENPLSKPDIERLLAKMGAQPSALIRLSPEEQSQFSEEDLLQMMVDNPALLNRPIVERKGAAFLCRPLEIIQEKMPDYDWSEYL
ncbi:ArsC/Spx/MgsR family protein [Streptococcus ferus]|uniref:Arsenate reductase n=1 Tax=Streptococcus ferus TaxID=1345 RepID=A0A2X3VFF7_9STRE|nr:ArsC/Spx/MgsR family protein [Streptococcus ferus]SQF40190.1 arsenate reductase [Streptococcus ferus]